MDTTFIKPNILVSACLGFQSCRYNGDMIKEPFIDKLKSYVSFVEVCPETAIGLGTPRETIRIVRENNKLKLYHPKSEEDISERMERFSEEFVKELRSIHGFILKGKSPSCGVKDAKIYDSLKKGSNSRKGNGIFADKIIENYRNYPIEYEGRLNDYKIREHFLTKIFLLAKFSEIEEKKSIEELISFHKKNKLLFMAYNQKELKELGRIVGSGEKNKEMLFYQYKTHLLNTISRMPRYTSNINVLMHSMGKFSDNITHKEKDFILNTIEKYREGRIPLSAPMYIIKGYAVRFDDMRLLEQSYFNPYPEELIEMRDSGKIRI